MMREPYQRMLSHWYDSDDGYPDDFARENNGIVVRMLVRDERTLYDRCCTEHEVQTAIDRLRTFAFVGLTEHWKLTVCLFHAMFGGEIRTSDFLNSRRGDHSDAKKNGKYDVHLLGDYDDEDIPVYEHAVAIFHRNLEIYGVTEDTCA